MFSPSAGGEQLSCQSALDDELFHPDRRWIADSRDSRPAVSTSRPRTDNREAPLRIASQTALQLGLMGVAAFAPAAAEKFGARMFFTPRRARRSAMPLLAHLDGRSFRLAFGEDQIAAWSWGQGRTVMLIHGWEGYAAQLIQFVEPLVAAGFRVVTFDMPAHGGSTGRQASAFDMARAILAVSQVFSPIRGIIAHSLGATASIFALTHGLEIDRAVLIAPAAEPNYFARLLATRLGLSNLRTAGMLKRIEDRFGMTLEEASILRLVPKLTAPVLVMHDSLDREVPFEQGRAIAETWPGATLELLHQLGHRRMLRDPKVIKAATDFISEERDRDALGRVRMRRLDSASSSAQGA